MSLAVGTRRGRHLSSLRQLRSHCNASGKRGAYDRLLRDYGVDTGAFSDLIEQPRLIYAEQPGCWFYAEDLLRARLLQALIDTGEFAPSSGVLSLSLDAFSDRGVKRWFCTFALCDVVPAVHLLGTSYRRRHRHRTYAALPVDQAALRRMSTLFNSSADMLEAARLSPTTFADELVERFQHGFEPGLRPLMPPDYDRASLLEYAESLRRYRLDQALRNLAAPCCELRPGISWADFWNAVNEQFFGMSIGPLGALYNRFILTVSDPVRMAKALRRDLQDLYGQDDARDVSVAAVITEEDKYRMVFFDAERESFYFSDGDEERQPIEWHEIRRQAKLGCSGGPSGVLAYLMMAAAGIYLVSDPVDGTSPFESAARSIHRQRIDLPFPSLAPTPGYNSGRGGFLKIFTPEFDRCSRQVLDRFLL